MSASPLQTPLFRPDLETSTETVDNTAYVRVTDPQTQKSTRLYALEFEVARAMDGRRSLSEIAAVISSTQGVTPSLTDLERFVAHLAEQNLVTELRAPHFFAQSHTEPSSEPTMMTPESPAAPAASGLETDTFAAASVDRHSEEVPPPSLARSTLVLSQASQPTPARQELEGTDTTLSPADAVSAGVYALVTEELDLGQLERPKAAPRPAESPAPITAKEASATPTEPDPPGAQGIHVRAAAAQAKRKRPWVKRLLPYLALLVLMAGGLVAFENHWLGLGGPKMPEVVVQPLKPSAHPVVAAQAAIEVHPARQTFLSATSSGPLATIVDSNARVAAGDIVATLRMSDDEMTALETARQDVTQVNARLESLTQERATLAQRRRDIQAQQQALAHGDMAARRKTLRALARRLVQSDRRDRVLRIGLVEARSEHARAVAALEGLEKRLAAYLVRAPFAGVIGEPRVAIGINTRAGQPLVALEDRQALTVSFPCTEPNAFELGAAVSVMVEDQGGQGRELAGVVDQLQPVSKTNQDRLGHVVVALKDTEAKLALRPPHVFHLVTGQASHAFWVPAAALGPAPQDNSAHFSAWSTDMKVAHQVGVELVDKRIDGSWVQLKDGASPKDTQLIVDCVPSMAALKHQGAIAIEAQAPHGT